MYVAQVQCTEKSSPTLYFNQVILSWYSSSLGKTRTALMMPLYSGRGVKTSLAYMYILEG